MLKARIIRYGLEEELIPLNSYKVYQMLTESGFGVKVVLELVDYDFISTRTIRITDDDIIIKIYDDGVATYKIATIDKNYFNKGRY